MAQFAKSPRPSNKQVAYALKLLSLKGYPVDYMTGAHKGIAGFRERNGTVEEWLRAMNFVEISQLIDKLKIM